jgi:uncharacterized membrane protein YcgQ (UPF0703/DUF1980 family)
MSKNKARRNCLIIALAIIAATASFFAVNYTKGTGSELTQGTAITSKNIRYEPPASNNGVVEIREKMFAAQVNDVYLNAKDYLGKTIKLEGLFKSELYDGKDEPYCFVIRYGPGGCCGLDANIGFEIAWDKAKAKPYPVVDSWVEATGVLKTYEEDGYSNYLYLDLSSLNVLSRRGAETVRQ